MKLPHRRHFLRLAAGALALPAIALPAMSRLAWTQTYPSRPVRIIVGLAPGGGTDIVARLIGQWLSERLGQSFVIENRPGGQHQAGVIPSRFTLPCRFTLPRGSCSVPAFLAASR